MGRVIWAFVVSLLFAYAQRHILARQSKYELFYTCSTTKAVEAVPVHLIMSEDRNFRSNYYKKFGFRNIEEKKSIELLLKEHPLDVEKLRQFCLRFPVSARYRLYLWKIVLGKSTQVFKNTTLGKIFSKQHCEIFFFSQKTGFDISCKFSLLEMIA